MTEWGVDRDIKNFFRHHDMLSLKDSSNHYGFVKLRCVREPLPINYMSLKINHITVLLSSIMEYIVFFSYILIWKPK